MAKLCKNADIAQPVERILGKDEVPGSNPGISSKNLVLRNGIFLLPQQKNSCFLFAPVCDMIESRKKEGML